MASGIPHAKWNNADVTEENVDLDAVAAWYRARGLPWGLRVPLEFDVTLGRPLFVKRCMGIVAGRFVPLDSAIRVREASANELDVVVNLDTAIGGDREESRRWIAPQLGAPRFRFWLALLRHDAVGLAASVQSDGDAGPAAYLTGVIAFEETVLDALVCKAVADAFEHGAQLVHHNPDDDDSARRIRRLGGVEVPGFEVRVVREA
jgi:hypothetical protein